MLQKHSLGCRLTRKAAYVDHILGHAKRLRIIRTCGPLDHPLLVPRFHSRKRIRRILAILVLHKSTAFALVGVCMLDNRDGLDRAVYLCLLTQFWRCHLHSELGYEQCTVYLGSFHSHLPPIHDMLLEYQTCICRGRFLRNVHTRSVTYRRGLIE